MADPFKPIIKAAEAPAPFNTYDSFLATPSGADVNQNAWLILQLRVKLNFVDWKNPSPRIVNQGGKSFARDGDGYLFPALDWPPHLVKRFQDEFVRVAEKTWNWQFTLKTPTDYDGLDITSYAGDGWRLRPNLLCLFRMSVLNAAGGPIDTTPAAGPLAVGPAHRTIDIVNLSLATKSVSKQAGFGAPGAPATKTVTAMDGLAFRSDDVDYDDRDLFAPAWWGDPKNHVLSNTVGHEVGHALGQAHIMGLKGVANYKLGASGMNDTASYGIGSTDPLDQLNIMGGGDRVYLINVVSWKERVALHTGVPANKWDATGIMTTGPRKIPLGVAQVAPPTIW
jgi:hypothetical protein